MRTQARTWRSLIALALTLSCGMVQAQVTGAPLVAPVPPAKPDPAPPLSPVPVTPPQQAQVPAAAAEVRAPVPAPPETTPPAAAARQAAELARGDPARWHKEDATEEQRLRTLRKEVAAAYEEAKVQCRQGLASERSRCMKEARAAYEKDMAGIRTGVSVR